MAQAPEFQAIEKRGVELKAGGRNRTDFVLLVLDLGCCECAPIPLEPPPVFQEPNTKLPPPLGDGPNLKVPAPATPEQNNLNCSLTGTTADSSGAVIANVAITITNLDTGAAQTLEANEQGQYSVNDLTAGRYSVRASWPGFKSTEKTGIVLQAGARERVDIVLTVGNVGAWRAPGYARTVKRPRQCG